MHKIVLTGGPCAGKSSCLTYLKQYLEQKGYAVYILNETATELVKQGVDHHGDQVVFQTAHIKAQKFKEDLIVDVAKKEQKDLSKTILLCDRGILDSYGFCKVDECKEALIKNSLSIPLVYNRYDAVIHLDTVAKGKPTDYNFETNDVRSETVSEAVKVDNKLIEIWQKHHRYFKISSEDTFDEKVKHLVACVNEVLNDI